MKCVISKSCNGDIMTDCIFCKIAQGELKASIIYADDDVVAFHDIKPQAPTHVLVIPRRHISSLNDCRPEDAAILGRLMMICKDVAEQAGLSETGFRIVINTGPDAGQVEHHIHFHLLGGRKMPSLTG